MGDLARAVALLRNTRGVGTDHWTPLELARLCLMWQISELGFHCEADRRPTCYSAAVSHESHLSAAQTRWWRGAHRAAVPAACPVEQLPCRCDPCLGRGQERAFWDSTVGGCSALTARHAQETSARSGGCHFRANPRHPTHLGSSKASMTPSMWRQLLRVGERKCGFSTDNCRGGPPGSSCC